MDTDTKTTDAAASPVSSLRRFTPFRDGGVDVETVAAGCVLAGMLCFACLLLAGCLDLGVLG